MKIETQIQKIVDTFGMKADIASKAMGVTTDTYRKKKSLKSLDHSFNQKNLEDLKQYVIKHADKLKKK